jgi:hypothetical protein
MKPTITIDERGVLLHLVDDAGKGFAVALNAETLSELGAQVAVALEKLREPEQRSSFLWNVARAVVRELGVGKGKDGPPEPDQR